MISSFFINQFYSKLRLIVQNVKNPHSTGISFDIPNEFEEPETFDKTFSSKEEHDNFIAEFEKIFELSDLGANITILPSGHRDEFAISVDGQNYTINSVDSFNPLESVYKGYLSDKLQQTETNINLASNTLNGLSKAYKNILRDQERVSSEAQIVSDERNANTGFRGIIRRLGNVFSKNKSTFLPVSSRLNSTQEPYNVDLGNLINTLRQIRDNNSDGSPYTNSEQEMSNLINSIIGPVQNGRPITFDSKSDMSFDDSKLLDWFFESLHVEADRLSNDAKLRQANLRMTSSHLQETYTKIKQLPVLGGSSIKSLEVPDISEATAKPDISCHFTQNRLRTLPPVVPYGNIHTVSSEAELAMNDGEFKRLAAEQSRMLTKDEKESVFIYKTAAFRQINTILKFMKNSGLTLEEAQHTPEFQEQINGIYPQLTKPCGPEDGLMGEYYNNTFLSKDYLKSPDALSDAFVHNIIPNLKSALNKVRTDRDLTVYRVTLNSEDANLQDRTAIASTTLGLKFAKQFLSNRRFESSNMNADAVFMKIKIPKGSPILIHSNELLTGREINPENPFLDEQKEITIDPTLFNFLTTKETQGKNTTYRVIQATPKVLSLNERTSEDLEK